MSTMRVYTREFRESAVGLVLSQGLSIRVAAEDLGMPYHTRHSWVRDKRRTRRKTIVNAPRKERRLAIGGRAVVRIHAESRQIYSSPKITRELPKLGLAAHRNTASQIMQECGIRAKHVRKYRPTSTQSAHAHARSPDLLAEIVPVPDRSSIVLNPNDPNALFRRQTLNQTKFGGVPIKRKYEICVLWARGV